MRFTVDAYGAADDRRISGEPPSPQAIAEDDETRVAGDIGLGKVPSENRRDMDHTEVPGCDLHAKDSLGLAVRQVEGAARARRRVLEHGALLGPVVKVPDRRASGARSQGLVDPDNAFAVVSRERPKQDGVDDAEDGDGRTDAERDGEDEHGRQHRAHRQLTDSEPKVVAPVGPPLRSAHGMLPLFCKCSADSLDVMDVAEAAQRFVARGRRRQTLRPELLDAHLEMERELVVHIGGRDRNPRSADSGARAECLP